MKFEDQSNEHKVDTSILEKFPVNLYTEKSLISIEEIQETYGHEEKIIVCDFYIDKLEKQKNVLIEKWGLEFENIINIDHHAAIESMQRFISSAPLAIKYVKENGPQSEAITVINHVDCDSVLSSAIMKGVIAPDNIFAEAAIAADHTGDENKIADLLQALQDKRNYDFSIRNLKLLLEGKVIEVEAQELLEKNKAEREKAKTFVEAGAFLTKGPISYALLDTKIESAFFPSLLPEASIIVTACPFRNENDKDASDKLELKIRLGKNTIPNLTLDKLNLSDTPIHFGGRWNAGSNKRAGGTTLNIDECVDIVSERLDKFLQKNET